MRAQKVMAEDEVMGAVVKNSKENRDLAVSEAHTRSAHSKNPRSTAIGDTNNG